MIRLDIQEYCQDCLDFEADVEKIKEHVGYPCLDLGERVIIRTIIRCEHRNRCKAIKRYLEKEAQNAENDRDQLRIQGVSGGE